jgi:hypothetical protein
MNNKRNDKTLESFKIFPYVAWGLTFLFTLFVYNIALELQAVASELQKQTQSLQEKVNTPVDQIEDFEN